MPIIASRGLPPEPRNINFCGHSYLNTVVGIFGQSFRLDAYVRHIFDIQAGATTNRALSGAKLVNNSANNGGYVTVLQQVTKSRRGAPYVNQDGTMILCWGINDMGHIPSVGGAAGMTQMIAAFKATMRAMIARHRTSSLIEDSDGSWAYTQGGGASNGWAGAGGTQSFASGSSITGTGINGNVATFTVPADYTGGALAFGFVGQSSGGAFNAAQTAGFGALTVTMGGTALTTGHAGGASASNGVTFSTSNMMPQGTTQAHQCVRVTDLDTTAAGKTVTFTLTTIDSGAGAKLYVDYAAIEATPPPLTIVCNIARLFPNVAGKGYDVYGASPWTGGTGYWDGQTPKGNTGDTDVAAMNVAISAVCAEFDSAVQVADLDGAFGGNQSLLYSGDGLHPNELGAVEGAKAIALAVRNAAAASPFGSTISNFPGGAAVRQQYFRTRYYTAERGQGQTTQAWVVNQLFAIPFVVTEQASKSANSFDLARVEVTTAATGGAEVVRWGIYDDEDNTGYPLLLVEEFPALGAAASAGGTGNLATLGFATSVPSGGARRLDYGLYWLAFKMDVAAVTVQPVFRAIQGPNRIMPDTDTTGSTTDDPIGWLATGVTAGALPGTFPTGAATTRTAPKMALRGQA